MGPPNRGSTERITRKVVRIATGDLPNTWNGSTKTPIIAGSCCAAQPAPPSPTAGWVKGLHLQSQLWVEAVEYLKNYREPVRQVTVADTVAQFIADREKQNRRPDTLRNLRGRLGMFSRLHGTKHVAEVTHDDCREFVFRKCTSPRNQINDRLAASNFPNWCVRRQFATANHMAEVDKPAVDTSQASCPWPTAASCSPPRAATKKACSCPMSPSRWWPQQGGFAGCSERSLRLLSPDRSVCVPDPEPLPTNDPSSRAGRHAPAAPLRAARRRGRIGCLPLWRWRLSPTLSQPEA